MREELEQRINDKNLFNNDFLKLPKIELEYLINNLKIENGIAKNDILKENLFASFFCVVNKIPLIICGKPGRGKTLSIKILEDSLKGKEFSTILERAFINAQSIKEKCEISNLICLIDQNS